MTASTIPQRRPKGYKGMAMEGIIANWYARITWKDIEEIKTLAKRFADQLPKGSHVLEVAPGPGYLSIELAKLGGYHSSGLDISTTFVEIERRKASEAGVQIDFRQGDAAYMPFADNTFDFAVCRAAFKNFTQPVRAIAEFHRVLKPGGKAVIIDLRPDASTADIDAYVNGLHLSAISSLMTRWTFRSMLLKNAHGEAELRKYVAQTGFGTADIRRDQVGYEVWLEKR